VIKKKEGTSSLTSDPSGDTPPVEGSDNCSGVSGEKKRKAGTSSLTSDPSGDTPPVEGSDNCSGVSGEKKERQAQVH
jgi:hypothetical protein